MNKTLIPHVRAMLALVAVVTIVVQAVAVPAVAASMAQSFPEVAHLQMPYTLGLILALVGVQVGVVAGWWMLRLDADGEFRAARVHTGSSVALGGLVFAVLMVGAVLVHAGGVAQIGGPAVIFGLLGCATALCAALPMRAAVRRQLHAN